MAAENKLTAENELVAEKPTSSPNIKEGSSQQDTNDSSNDEPEKKWGYDLYPERKGGTFSPKWYEYLMFKGNEELDRKKCERRVWKMVHTHPLLKIMLRALKSSGCEVDLSRHIACELCDSTVTGGYDIASNQVVVCQNMCKSDGLVVGVLTHEMLHMFDHCRNKLDFTNPEHLACTEIRAANLTHCSILSSIAQWDTTIGNLAKSHQECVKTKAAYSVVAVTKMNIEDARAIVNKVFPKCYADLEPIGRRVRRNSIDANLAFKEMHHYGY